MKRGRKKGVPTNAASPATAGRLVTLEQAIVLANQHWSAGQAEPAERICLQIITVRPGHAEALHLLGLIAYARNKSGRAIDYLIQASRAPDAPALILSNLTEMYRQSGRLAEAEEAGRRAVAQDAAFAAGWSNLGIVLQERGNLGESRGCLERAVALNPRAADAQSNLGNTLKKLGELKLAGLHYEQAIALDPNHALAHSNFAVTLNDLGEHARARAHAARAMTIAPTFADGYINAAAVEARVGDNQEALRLLDAALAFAPNNARVLTSRAEALHTLDRLAEALCEVERALALEPANGESCNLRARILQALHRHDEALAGFDQAATLLPEPATAIANKAVLLMEIGRTQESSAAFDSALALQPSLASAWYNRADAKKFAKGDPDIATMNALLESGRVESYTDRVCLHFALGKAHLDAGEPAQAFARLREGNRLKRATFAYDAAQSEIWMASIATHFPAVLFDRHPESGALSQTPLFVLGMPRSGTTLIEQILASHPQVHGAGELGYLLQSLEFVRQSNGLPPYPQAADILQPQHLAQIGHAYLDKAKGLAPDAARIVDKLPGNFLYAGLIHLALPGARIIHCRRDAVDTCLSCYSKLFTGEHEYAYDLAELGKFYRSYETLMQHWRRVLPSTSYIEIDYESVVDDLEGAARRLIEFSGLPWDEACLNFHTTRRPVRTASMNQVRQPIYGSSVGRWQAYREHLSPLLAALGHID
jgi:tetratricopeptide (TPR) repeat protein